MAQDIRLSDRRGLAVDERTGTFETVSDAENALQQIVLAAWPALASTRGNLGSVTLAAEVETQLRKALRRTSVISDVPSLKVEVVDRQTIRITATVASEEVSTVVEL